MLRTLKICALLTAAAVAFGLLVVNSASGHPLVWLQPLIMLALGGLLLSVVLILSEDDGDE